MALPQSDFTSAYRRPVVDTRLVRDLLALLLIVAGAVGLVTVAFLTDERLGWATVFGSALTAGVLLGLNRTR